MGKFILVFLGAILFWIAIPYFVFGIKRLVNLSKLRLTAKKNGYKIRGTHIFWRFSSTKYGNADFFIEGNCDIVYSVKLIGALKLHTWQFKNDSTYGVKKLRSFYSGFRFSKVFKYHTFPEYNFEYKNTERNTTKNIVPVILFLPVATSITIVKSGAEVHINDGDLIGNASFYNCSGLIRKLEEWQA